MRASPVHSQWRWLAAALLIEIAAIHIALVPAHLREAPYAGGLFIALSGASLVLAARMLVRDDPLAWMAAGGLAAGAIAAYVISRSIGLPMMSDDLGDWLNPLGVGAVCAEAIATGIALAVLWRYQRAQLQRGPASRVSPLAQPTVSAG